jgi:hypothetical protein
MTDVIYEMSRKKLGLTTVQADGKLLGVISDGDLRRLLEREGGAALSKTAGEAMNRIRAPSPPRSWPRGRWPSWKSARSLRWWWSMRRACRRRAASARSLGDGVDLRYRRDLGVHRDRTEHRGRETIAPLIEQSIQSASPRSLRWLEP